MMPELVEPKNNIELCDVGVMLNTGNNGRISVHFGGPHVSFEDSLDLYYDGELDADGRQTKYDEIEAKLKKLGWSPLKIHVESYQGNKMTFNKAPLRISEELQLKLAKAVYAEDACASGCASPAGSPASAANLGPLPKVIFGGAGAGFEQRRRKRLASEEAYSGIGKFMVEDFLQMVGMRNQTSEAENALQNAAQGGEDGQEPSVTEPEDDDGEGVEEAMAVIDGALKALCESDHKCMVSWADPRIVDNSALHKEQRDMGNGLHYVVFSGVDKASGFYKELRDKGIFNVKLDML